MKLITYLKELLASKEMRMQVIKDELAEVREKYGDERRSQIEYSGGDVSIEDLIADESVVITISHAGYIKRTSLSEYKTQNRGGVGQKSAGTRDQDFLEHLFVATNHQYLMYFTQKGKCYWMRVYEIPEGTKASKGRAIQNLINIEPDDKVKAFICTQDLKDQEYIKSHNLIMVTKQGQVKKTSLEKYSKPRVNGVAAITIKEGDELLGAKLTNGTSQVLIAGKSGKIVRFEEEKTRPMGRTASGVRGITLANENDEVIGIVTIDKDDVNESQILVVTENGYGKRTKLVDDDGVDVYRITNRGGKGVKTLNITEKTGALIAINDVTDADDLMIINKSGLTIRMKVSDLRVMGRATQGVRLINIKGTDSIAAVTKVLREDEAEEVSDEFESDVEDGEIDETSEETQE
jgi:DNA gyrase subunit A